MKRNFYTLVVILFAIFLTSCNRDEIVTDSTSSTFEATGVYVLSEGSFSVSNSSKLSFYSSSKDTFYQSIFTPGNLGSYPDGMVYYNNNLYVTEQGSYGGEGVLYKLDTNGTVLQSINAGINPYSLTITNNKIFITNGPSNSVTVVDLNSFSVMGSVPVGAYPQEIISLNGKVFVCNTIDYSAGVYDSTVTVIDASSNGVLANIKVRLAPSAFAITNDNKLLVGCPGDSSSGIIYKVDPDDFSIVDSFTTSFGFNKDISVDENSNDIYFISYQDNIVKLNTSTKSSQIIISDPDPASGSIFSCYGYAYDFINLKHYVTDAKQFSTNGSLYIFNSSGILEDTFETGVGPRRIVVKVN